MPSGLIQTIINLGVPICLIAIGYVIGHVVERRHFQSLARREAASGPVLTNLKTIPAGVKVVSSQLCVASVVIANDYFKQFGAKLKTLVGGRLRTLETLLERGRREALQRMREQASQGGANLVLNVRLETSILLVGKGGKSSGPAEVIAYGTAIRVVPAEQ